MAERQAAFEELQDENGDLEIPCMLHYDKRAYDGLKEIVDENNQALLASKLGALDFNQNKILKIKERAEALIAQVDEAKKKAEEKKRHDAKRWDDTSYGKRNLNGVVIPNGDAYDDDRVELINRNALQGDVVA